MKHKRFELRDVHSGSARIQFSASGNAMWRTIFPIRTVSARILKHLTYSDSPSDQTMEDEEL